MRNSKDSKGRNSFSLCVLFKRELDRSLNFIGSFFSQYAQINEQKYRNYLKTPTAIDRSIESTFNGSFSFQSHQHTHTHTPKNQMVMHSLEMATRYQNAMPILMSKTDWNFECAILQNGKFIVKLDRFPLFICSACVPVCMCVMQRANSKRAWVHSKRQVILNNRRQNSANSGYGFVYVSFFISFLSHISIEFYVIFWLESLKISFYSPSFSVVSTNTRCVCHVHWNILCARAWLGAHWQMIHLNISSSDLAILLELVRMVERLWRAHRNRKQAVLFGLLILSSYSGLLSWMTLNKAHANHYIICSIWMQQFIVWLAFICHRAHCFFTDNRATIQWLRLIYSHRVVLSSFFLFFFCSEREIQIESLLTIWLRR